MKITSVNATPVSILFREPEIWSQGIRHGVTAVIVEIETDDGISGIGESVPAPTPEVTIAAINAASSLLIGRDPREIVHRWLDLLSQGGWCSFPYVGNAAMAGIEIVCWDILGKSLNAPVHVLLGGAIRQQVPIMGFVQNTTPEQIEREAHEMVSMGYKTLYTKVGIDEKKDLEAARSLRKGAGPDVPIRVDANEAWSPGTALRMAHAMANLDLQYIEQPIRMRALSEMALLRRRSPVPIAANQSSWLNWDILDILKIDAADVIMSDPWQSGGISGFYKAAALCEAAGLLLVYHSFAPLTIATRAAMQILCSSSMCFLAHLTYHHILCDDIVTEPEVIELGHIKVQYKPGLGLEIDREKIRKYNRAYREDGYLSAYDNDNVLKGKSFTLPNQ